MSSADSNNPDSDVDKLAKGMSLTLGGSLVGRGLDLGSQLLLARVLGPFSFGIYAIGFNTFRLLGILAPLGLDRAAVRFAVEKKAHSASIIRTSLQLAMIVGTLLASVLFLATFVIPQNECAAELPLALRLFAVAIPLMGGITVAASITTLTHTMRYSVIVRDFVQPISNLLLICIALAVGGQLFGVIVATVVSYAIGFVWAMVYVRQRFPRTTQDVSKPIDLKAILAFSIPTTFAGIFINLLQRIDRIMVGFLDSPEAAGIYQAASQLAMLFAILLGAISGIFIPLIAQLHKDQELERLKNLYRIATKWSLFLSMPPCLVTLLAPELVMRALYSTDYLVGANVLRLLAVSQLCSASVGPVGPLLIMTNHQQMWLKMAGAALVLNVVLNVALIYYLGTTGAAIASVIAVFCLYGSAAVAIGTMLQVQFWDKRYWKGVLSALVAVVAVVWIRDTVSLGPILHLTLVSATAVICFIGALALLGWEAEDRQLFAIIQSKLATAKRQGRGSS